MVRLREPLRALLGALCGRRDRLGPRLVAALGIGLRGDLEPGAADAARRARAALGPLAAAARMAGLPHASPRTRLALLPSPSLWQLLDFALSSWFFGTDHAVATFEQRVLWRSAWAVFIYTALVSGFGGALHARRAHRAALATAQAEAALVRAELAAISGKLNPHFLFNTLNSIIFLTRKDAGAAERALLSFARMLRYLLDANRGAADRVPLREELDFVRDYLDLETLRLGTRLAVAWRIDDAALDAADPAAHSAAAGRERDRSRHRAARRARHSADRR